MGEIAFWSEFLANRIRASKGCMYDYYFNNTSLAVYFQTEADSS